MLHIINGSLFELECAALRHGEELGRASILQQRVDRLIGVRCKYLLSTRAQYEARQASQKG